MVQSSFVDENKVFIWTSSPRDWMKSGVGKIHIESRVKFPKSVPIRGAMSSAEVGSLRFPQFTVKLPGHFKVLYTFFF